MASTDADICNIALGRIGQRQFIGALSDANSTEAATCTVFYNNDRDSVLEQFPWQFATARAELTSPANVTRTGWSFVYQLPADCLFARYIDVPGATFERRDQRIPFVLEGDPTFKKLLLCNLSTVELVYTQAVTDPNLFSALFVDLLAWRLAVDLALALPIKPQVAKSMQDGLTAAMAMAAKIDWQQSQAPREPEASYIRARGFPGRRRWPHTGG